MSKPNTQTPVVNSTPAPVPAPAPASAPKPAMVTQTDNGYRLPSPETLAFAVKLSISEDKPIMMDYWTCSIDKSVLIGHKSDGSGDKKNTERMLVRSEEEYTSPISKIYKQGDDMIIITENSIYIVDAKIPSRRISV